MVLGIKVLIRDHSFNTYAKFSEKLTFPAQTFLTFIWIGLMYFSNGKTRTISNIVTPRRVTLQNLTLYCFNLCAEISFTFT